MNPNVNPNVSVMPIMNKQKFHFYTLFFQIKPLVSMFPMLETPVMSKLAPQQSPAVHHRHCDTHYPPTLSGTDTVTHTTHLHPPTLSGTDTVTHTIHQFKNQ